MRGRTVPRAILGRPVAVITVLRHRRDGFGRSSGDAEVAGSAGLSGIMQAIQPMTEVRVGWHRRRRSLGWVHLDAICGTTGGWVRGDCALAVLAGLIGFCRGPSGDLHPRWRTP